jgi:hypothetical protein
VKSFREIQKTYAHGDLQRVAEIAKCSVSTVKMVVNGHRTDHKNIQKIFSDLIEARERLSLREAGRRARKAERESKRMAA